MWTAQDWSMSTYCLAQIQHERFTYSLVAPSHSANVKLILYLGGDLHGHDITSQVEFSFLLK